jgi:hypothetical protein
MQAKITIQSYDLFAGRMAYRPKAELVLEEFEVEESAQYEFDPVAKAVEASEHSEGHEYALQLKVWHPTDRQWMLRRELYFNYEDVQKLHQYVESAKA